MGAIKFPNAPLTLANSSCMIVKLSDISFMDVPSNELASVNIDVSGKKVDRSIQYSLRSGQPLRKYLEIRTFAVSAIVVKGRCADFNSDSLLQKGDYMSMGKQVRLRDKRESYFVNLPLSCYGK